jgi:MtaA/CmuA family methyltransferase
MSVNKKPKLFPKNKKQDKRYNLFHPILMHFAARFNNKKYSEFAANYKVLVESNIKCLEYFNHDAVSLISDPYRETAAFGAKIEFMEDSVPRCCSKIINTIEDINKLKNPDVYKNERTLDRINGAKYYRKLLKDNVPIIGWIEGSFAEACDLAGVSEILLKMAMEPDFVKLLMEKCLATGKDFAKAQIEAGCNVMGVGDAICSQISADMYRENILQLHMELFNYLHSLGVLVKLHICGNINHLLPELKKTGADIIDIDWMVDIDKAHKELGDDVIICGNLDPVSVIQNLSAKEVYNKSKKIVDKELNRNFILSGGCEITVNTPKENLKAMREASNIV